MKAIKSHNEHKIIRECDVDEQIKWRKWGRIGRG